MASGHGVDKPRREGEVNRQVHRERFGGSADAMAATFLEREAREQLTGGFAAFRSFNATRGDKWFDKWPGEAGWKGEGRSDY
jgi:hypothetical protein